jgi:flavin reductase (DIM6/NTAB) family NADH-FMN oxidoreductase RutF
MNPIKSVELAKSYVLLNHGPVTLVSATSGGERNVMAAAWSMPLDFNPPKVAVVIDKTSYTRKLIESSGQFVLSIPTKAIADKVLAVGSVSGSEIDKFAAYGLGTIEIEGEDKLPMIEGCAAWLECRVISEPHNQTDHDLFIGEVVGAWADTRVFKDGRWSFEQEELRTIHYVAGGNFFTTGNKFEVSLPGNDASE